MKTDTADIMQLLDAIDDVLAAGWKLPGLSRVLLDGDRLAEMVSSIREQMPREVLSARQIALERGQLMEEAQQEAMHVVEQARSQASVLVSKDTVYAAAEQKAQMVLQQARLEAEDIRASADLYVAESLNALEERLADTLETVRNGIATLHEPHSST